MADIKTFLRTYRWDIVAVGILLIVAGIPRLVDLGTFLTADEKNWIGRSYEFIRAFKDFRFNDMLQTTHPGVTAMWLIGAAVTAKMFVAHLPFSFNNLVHFVTAAQFPIALVNTLAVPAMYVLLRILFCGGKEGGSQLSIVNCQLLPLAAAVFIALDPFIIGYSRVAHVDALLASLMFLAALATMRFGQTNFSRRWLVISAVLSGLAILTKAPAVFLLPWLALIMITHQPQLLMSRHLFAQRLRDGLLWLVMVVLLFVLLWPAILWVPNPEGNVLILKRDLAIAAATPHNMTEEYTLNSSFYLNTLLTRTTPVTLGFGVFSILYLVSRICYRKIPNTKYQIPNTPLWLLLAYVFFFLLMMTTGAKKGDRYILPVFPALDVLAAFGVWYFVSSIWYLVSRVRPQHTKYQIQNTRYSFVALAFVLMIYLGSAVARYHPYAIAYSNPLFPDNLSQELGWGEGLEQVAAWFNKNDPQAVVASWYPEELGAYTSAQVAHINAHEQGKVRYVVLYRNMFGRAPDHYANNFIDEYYKKRQPVFVAKVVGKEFAWVYEKWVFEQVVGELIPGVRAGQQVIPQRDNLVGIDVLVATYSGRAVSGELVIAVRSAEGSLIQQWRVPVETIDDDRWLTVRFDHPYDGAEKPLVVEIFAEGTAPNDAPTIRYARKSDVRPGEFSLNGQQRAGDIAVRLRYVADGPAYAQASAGQQEMTEEDTKLLQVDGF